MGLKQIWIDETKESRDHLGGNRLTQAEWILLCVLIAVFLIMLRYIFTEGNRWISSDSASVILYAVEMLKKGQLFPEGWHHGTGISLLPFPVCLFMMLGADYLLARNLAQMLFALLILISIILFSRKYLQNNSWILIVPLLFSYISDVQYQMFFVEAAYASQIFILFFSLVCFIWVVEMEPLPRLQVRRIPAFAFYTACTAFCGGVFFQQFILPLCTALVFLYLLDSSSSSPANKLRHISATYKWIVVAILLAGLMGILVYAKICGQIHIDRNQSLVTFRESYADYAENLSMIFQSFLANAGIRGNVLLFSLAGIQNVLGLVLAAAVWIVFPILAFKDFKKKTRYSQILLIFTLVHITEVFILLLFGDSALGAKARYMLSSLSLLSVISGDYIYKHYIKKTNTGVFIAVILAATFGTLSLSAAKISYSQQSLSQMRALTDYLKENGLEYGYASYWDSHKYSVLSNGEVLIRPVKIETGTVTQLPLLSSEDWYDPEYFEGRTFLMLTDDEAAAFAPNGYDYTNLYTPETVLNYEPYTILVYDHNIARNNFNDMLGGEANLLGRVSCSDTTMRQENGEIFINEGQIMYGPYIPLNTGEYLLTVDVSLVSPGEIVISAADAGGEVLGIYELTDGRNEYRFTLEEGHSQVEFVIQNQTDQEIYVSGMYLLLKDDGSGI